MTVQQIVTESHKTPRTCFKAMLHKFKNITYHIWHGTVACTADICNSQSQETCTHTLYMYTVTNAAPLTKQVKLQSMLQCVLTDMSSWELGFREVHFWMSLHEPKQTHKYDKHTPVQWPFVWNYLGESAPERSKRQWVAVAWAGPYANLHLDPFYGSLNS